MVLFNRMNRKSLSQTNPYLKDKTRREKLLIINVSSSSTIELGELSTPLKKALKTKQPTFIYISPEIEKDLSQ